MKENYVEPMVVDKNGNIYYSAKCINELENEEKQKLEQEIERLTELCNKYEEEHKTTFETWQKDIKENELLHSIIKEAREYIEKNTITNISWLGTKATKKELFKDNASLYELLEILNKVGEE